MAHKNLQLSAATGDEVKTNTCYMCACRCGIRVHLKNGRVRYIDGNPKHPVNRGVICAKGSSGIMQHYSPARLRKPLLRTGERGERKFREIEWDEALSIATKWLSDIRARNPDELAFFTGRDQSQALTGWWAQQFGTINYAAHGGFCSVNMAAAGMYTFGGSFWEFGEPDWARTKYLMLWGVAEDHDSNPIKLGLGKLKTRGAKIVVVNPVRSGYGAIADEWIAINPGTDGLLAGALIHELLIHDRVDFEYLVRYSNAHHLVIYAPGSPDDGLIARGADGKPLCAVRPQHHPHPGPPLEGREQKPRRNKPRCKEKDHGYQQADCNHRSRADRQRSRGRHSCLGQCVGRRDAARAAGGAGSGADAAHDHRAPHARTTRAARHVAPHRAAAGEGRRCTDRRRRRDGHAVLLVRRGGDAREQGVRSSAYAMP